MKLSEFILEYLNGEIEHLGALCLYCNRCPLREVCRADEDARVEAGLEGESCGEFLARMLFI